MEPLSLALFGTSRKENEHRLPIHPLHLDRIDADLRARIFLEQGYGERFGMADAQLAPLVAGLRSRQQLLTGCEVVVLPKPTEPDIAELRPGQVLWGWPHCVQDYAVTQLGIDHRLTMIAWEAMNYWTTDGSFGVHVFHMNNELAGYCSVLHALQLRGRTGAYGPRLQAVVISCGATARGAVTALMALGIFDVTVLTHRKVPEVASPIPSVRMIHFERAAGEPGRILVRAPGGRVPIAEFLARHDIVVNCVLQDTDAPLMFVMRDELGLFAPGSLFVDVSCDEGMGFEWARPTSFAEPLFAVGGALHYYAVDHSPSYLWNSATWEISEALLPHLRTVMDGPGAWDRDEAIRRAIEIRDGVVRNPKILSFQRRSAEFPYPPM
jgi:alanine dehydrogenase